MAVSLTKSGQAVSLRKKEDNGLEKLMVGVGWDMIGSAPATKKSGFFSRMRSAIEATATQTGAAMDIDLSIFAFKGGNFVEKIYFGDRNSNDGSINLSEDNRTGKGDGDDEKAILDALRCTYDRLFFTVNIYRARENNQHFGQVANAYICVRDPKKPVDKPESELVRYNLSEDYNGKSSIICAEARLNDGNIEFIAIGEGSNDGSLADVERRLIQRVRQSA